MDAEDEQFGEKCRQTFLTAWRNRDACKYHADKRVFDGEIDTILEVYNDWLDLRNPERLGASPSPSL